MTIEEIQQICRGLNGVTEDVKWEDHLCFSVGGKMFLVTAPDLVPVSASIKVSDDDFETLPLREGIIEAPYLARHKWIRLDNISLWSEKDWQHYIREAHRIVAEKLPLKTRKELGLPAHESVKPVAKKGHPAKRKLIKKR